METAEEFDPTRGMSARKNAYHELFSQRRVRQSEYQQKRSKRSVVAQPNQNEAVVVVLASITADFVELLYRNIIVGSRTFE